MKHTPKRTPLRKQSKIPIARLKKKADAIFSVWVRMQGAWEQNGEYWNYCYTSGKPYPVKLLQCGHFRSRVHSATRYDPDNARPQSFAENVWKRGNIAVYAIRLLDEIGETRMRAVVTKSQTIFKLTTPYLEEIIQKFSPT